MIVIFHSEQIDLFLKGELILSLSVYVFVILCQLSFLALWYSIVRAIIDLLLWSKGSLNVRIFNLAYDNSSNMRHTAYAHKPGLRALLNIQKSYGITRIIIIYSSLLPTLTSRQLESTFELHFAITNHAAALSVCSPYAKVLLCNPTSGSQVNLTASVADSPYWTA